MRKIFFAIILFLGALPNVFAQNTLYFDGKDDYVSAPMTFKFSKPFTAEAWIITSKKKGWQPIFGVESSNAKQAGGFFSFGLMDKNLAVYVWDNGQSEIVGQMALPETARILPGDRHHAAVSFDGKDAKVYLDGVLAGTFPIKLKDYDNGLVYIGGSPQKKFFSGTIDRIKLWKKAFEPAEIPALMYSETSTDELAVFYTCDQAYSKKDMAASKTLYDFKGGQNGALQNFALATDSSGWVLLTRAQSDIYINLPSPSASELKIGDIYEGGMVFFVDIENKYGLVCTLENQIVSAQNSFPWSNVMGMYSITNAKGGNVGKGQENTEIMVKFKGHAALVCDNLETNGKADWFLPSKDEMLLLYEKIHLTGLNEFAAGPYWTSTEDNLAYAWALDFKDAGKPFTVLKRNKCYVRAIRKFVITH